MPCYKPMTAYQDSMGGKLTFTETRPPNARQLHIACGQCYGCKMERSRQMAIRCMHEASLHKNNSFITLTYDDEHLPYRGQLVREHWQLFAKRLRKKYGPGSARYYMCGEYGTQYGRPHFHACLFGHDWDDKEFYTKNETGDTIYNSENLERLWGMGLCTTARVTFNSAAYVTRYCIQKRTGPIAEEWYQRIDELGIYQLEPEFGQPSLKPGLGAKWIEKYHADVYTTDNVLQNGRKGKPPSYYDDKYKNINPDHLEEIKLEREMEAHHKRWDNTPDRLAVKEIVARAAHTNLKRHTL